MKAIYFLPLLAFIIVGCKSDDAPNVDDVSHIVVEGKTYSAREYISTFCQKPESSSDKNCIKVDKKRISDQTAIVPLSPN